MHPFLTATRDATSRCRCNADNRLAPSPSSGVLELRVANTDVERALALAQAVIDGSETAGLEVVAVRGGRGHRAGVGIGREGRFTAIRIDGLRMRVPVTEAEIELWLDEHHRRMADEWRLRERGYHVRADGRLRVLLARRHDRPPDPREGWRWSFTDEVDRPLEDQVADVVAALTERSVV